MYRASIRGSLFAALALAAVSPAAAYVHDDPAPFDAAPVGNRILATSFGTGSGYEANYAVMLRERTRIDGQVFADLNGVAMDNWWAYTGSVLIAASLR